MFHDHSTGLDKLIQIMLTTQKGKKIISVVQV